MIFGQVRQRLPRFENRALLDLAHRVKVCVNCSKYVGDGCEPAHSNLQLHGRGKDNKADDNHHAALCHACHDWYDYGTKEFDPTGVWQPTRESKQQFFAVMEGRTMDHYWREGWLKVVAR